MPQDWKRGPVRGTIRAGKPLRTEDAMADTIVSAEDAEARISGILAEFDVADMEVAGDYLRGKPEVAQLLGEVPQKAAHYFGAGTRVGLEVVADSEYFPLPELFVFVITTLEPEAAWEGFSAMETEWWLDRVTDGSVNLDVRFA